MSKRRTRQVPIQREIKRRLGYKASEPDSEILKHWKAVSTRVCKPCWELRYCPYGPLVEQSPLLPPKRSEAVQHNEYLTQCLETGKLADGKALDPDRRRIFKHEVQNFRPSAYPEAIPVAIDEMQCTVFGHICPVVFSAEGFTETSQRRRAGRYIPFRTKMRVVRRDNHTCQHCGKHLKDDEIEFDHIIPLAKGGSSDEQNVRLTCHDCNSDSPTRLRSDVTA